MRPEIVHAIQALEHRHGGRLTPDQVIEEARAKDSPLHDYFTWDPKKASQECWRNEARALIRAVQVDIRIEQMTIRVPMYVRDPALAGDVQGYVSLARLRTDEELARDAVIAEFSRATAALKRAQDIARVLGVVEEIEEVRERVAEIADRMRTAEPAAA